MEIGEIFFWTATIHQWHNLLEDDRYKQVIINSLKHLTDTGMIEVFAFVIMPTHVHFIWRSLQLNGKETAQGSFLKYTAHEFKKLAITETQHALERFRVDASNKVYEFWQRDPLAIHLFSKEVAFQKMDYVHSNPCSGKWKLCTDPCDYKFSSATWYEAGEKPYLFLKDLREEF